MKTINRFDVVDLDEIAGLPLLELDEDFPSFSPSNLGFSVGKRTKIITRVKKDKKSEYLYFLGALGEEVCLDDNRVKTAADMVKKLNESDRWYRLATNEEIRYIFMKQFSWFEDIKVYEKMK